MILADQRLYGIAVNFSPLLSPLYPVTLQPTTALTLSSAHRIIDSLLQLLRTLHCLHAPAIDEEWLKTHKCKAEFREIVRHWATNAFNIRVDVRFLISM